MCNKADIMEAAGQDPRWRVVALRDRTFDGQFYYAVKTTGVYCRPSCAARKAKPENVSSYASCEDAERAGFRPCKRCKPNEPSLAARHAAKVAEICRGIETAIQIPSLNEMASRAGMSAYHFHRLFKAVTTVTGAIYDAGFNSSGRFYETSDAMLGMTPATYRDGGKDTRICFDHRRTLAWLHPCGEKR
jgi:AraC family transcriptional regulator, regulatory protein of adaptative response / methylated-DNA-[protein]-cysteine methyltransferase